MSKCTDFLIIPGGHKLQLDESGIEIESSPATIFSILDIQTGDLCNLPRDIGSDWEAIISEKSNENQI